MSIQIMMRRRATLSEAQRALNTRFLTKLADLSGFWANGKRASDTLFTGGEEISTLIFGDVLIDGLVGEVTYMPRFPGHLSRDRATADDVMTLMLDTAKIDCNAFCHNVLPKLLEIFGAYRAALETDADIAAADHSRLVTLYRGRGPDRNGRDGVIRIWPVNFFDEVLCRRAFGIGAEEVVRRAEPECEHAEFILGGAFLIVTSDIVRGETALDALNARIMQCIDTRAAAQAASD